MSPQTIFDRHDPDIYNDACTAPAARINAELEAEHPLADATFGELFDQYLAAGRKLAATFTFKNRDHIFTGHMRCLVLESTPPKPYLKPQNATPAELRVATITAICWANARIWPENKTFHGQWVKAARRIVTPDRSLNTVSDRSAQVPA